MRATEKQKEYMHQYYVKNREKALKRMKEYHNTHREYRSKYHKGYYIKNRERILRHDKEYQTKHREDYKKYRQERKLKVLQKISGLTKPICVGCGCDDLRLLEINHINGGGRRERRTISYPLLLAHILNGTRKTKDLNVRCRGCNAIHYMKMKYGDIPMRVVWGGEV